MMGLKPKDIGKPSLQSFLEPGYDPISTIYLTKMKMKETGMDFLKPSLGVPRPHCDQPIAPSSGVILSI
jgi:hypothetical protein